MMQDDSSAAMTWPGDFTSWQAQFRELISSIRLPEGQLRRWMDGLDLPFDDPGAGPAMLIVHALPPDSGRYLIASNLVTLLKTLSEEQPTPQSNKRLYNSLQLAAMLAKPSLLAEVLEHIALNRSLRGRKTPGVGFPLTLSLYRALFYNQPQDGWLELIWKPVIERKELATQLDLSPLDGFDAILAVPSKYIPSALRWALPSLAKSIKAEEHQRVFGGLPARASRHPFAPRHGVTEDVIFRAMVAGECPNQAILFLPGVQSSCTRLRKLYVCTKEQAERAAEAVLEQFKAVRNPLSFSAFHGAWEQELRQQYSRQDLPLEEALTCLVSRKC